MDGRGERERESRGIKARDLERVGERLEGRRGRRRRCRTSSLFGREVWDREEFVTTRIGRFRGRMPIKTTRDRTRCGR